MRSTLTVNREITVTKVIIGGKFRSGKDTAAYHMGLAHGYLRTAFADKVKDVAHDLFPNIPREPKPRKLYVDVGEKAAEIDPQVWIRHVERQIETWIRLQADMGYKEVNIVVTDLRKQVEYDWARSSGFTVIRVTAPEDVRIARAVEAGDTFNANDLAHETETAIDTFSPDFEVVNDGTVAELQAQIDRIMAEMAE